jgi:hypothetical protein
MYFKKKEPFRKPFLKGYKEFVLQVRILVDKEYIEVNSVHTCYKMKNDKTVRFSRKWITLSFQI